MINKFQKFQQIKDGLSKKKIYRIFEGKLNKVVIDFSENKKEFNNFLNVYEILKKINISIPKIYEVYLKEKIIVMEDFGNKKFDKILNKEELYVLLKLAIDNLIIIQNSVILDDLAKLEKYKYSDLEKEVSEFVDYYIPYKKISKFPTEDFYASWKKIFNDQKFEINSFVHKDYEFINLILLNNNSLHLKCGIIDFQGALIGFKGWDLFSILENPRIDFTRKYNEDLIKYFYENTNILSDFNSFRNHYYLLNLARQTRLIGRWVKLFYEGHEKYLNFINPTKIRINSCLKNIHDNKLKNIYKMVFST